jgi:hypothetical protein
MSASAFVSQVSGADIGCVNQATAANGQVSVPGEPKNAFIAVTSEGWTTQ